MSQQPTVTVLMSVYNDAAYVGEAIGSIIEQTWQDWELLIINDGSTDESAKVIENFVDGRIKFINNPKNLGLTRSLKKGVEQARCKYLARMDADDIALPERLENQVNFLDQNLDVGIVGTKIIYFDDRTGIYEIPSVLEDHLNINWTVLFGSPFPHPSVMIRKSVLDQYDLNYDPKFLTAQDYDLWTKLLTRTKGANLSTPLLKYRLRQGISQSRKAEQYEFHRQICCRTIQSQFPELNLTSEEIYQIGARFFNPDIFAPVAPSVKSDREILQILTNYFYLLRSFLKKYPSSPASKNFKKIKSIEIGRELIKLNKSQEWLVLTQKLLNFSPELPLWFLENKLLK